MRLVRMQSRVQLYFHLDIHNAKLLVYMLLFSSLEPVLRVEFNIDSLNFLHLKLLKIVNLIVFAQQLMWLHANSSD